MDRKGSNPESLCDLLAEEMRLLGQYRVLIEEERAALSTLSAERVYETSKRKETLALQVRVLEEARESLCRNLARSYGAPGETTLLGLSRRCPAHARKRLLELRRRLRDEAAAISRYSETNRLALDSSRQWIGLAVNVLRSLGADRAGRGTYGATGEMAGDVRGRILDRRTV